MTGRTTRVAHKTRMGCLLASAHARPRSRAGLTAYLNAPPPAGFCRSPPPLPLFGSAPVTHNGHLRTSPVRAFLLLCRAAALYARSTAATAPRRFSPNIRRAAIPTLRYRPPVSAHTSRCCSLAHTRVPHRLDSVHHALLRLCTFVPFLPRARATTRLAAVHVPARTPTSRVTYTRCLLRLRSWPHNAPRHKHIRTFLLWFYHHRHNRFAPHRPLLRFRTFSPVLWYARVACSPTTRNTTVKPHSGSLSRLLLFCCCYACGLHIRTVSCLYFLPACAGCLPVGFSSLSPHAHLLLPFLRCCARRANTAYGYGFVIVSTTPPLRTPHRLRLPFLCHCTAGSSAVLRHYLCVANAVIKQHLAYCRTCTCTPLPRLIVLCRVKDALRHTGFALSFCMLLPLPFLRARVPRRALAAARFAADFAPAFCLFVPSHAALL